MYVMREGEKTEISPEQADAGDLFYTRDGKCHVITGPACPDPVSGQMYVPCGPINISVQTIEEMSTTHD